MSEQAFRDGLLAFATLDGLTAARASMPTGAATTWEHDEAGGLAAAVIHAAYHLGAIGQIVKLDR